MFNLKKAQNLSDYPLLFNSQEETKDWIKINIRFSNFQNAFAFKHRFEKSELYNTSPCQVIYFGADEPNTLIYKVSDNKIVSAIRKFLKDNDISARIN
jgi:hypothetical protein